MTPTIAHVNVAKSYRGGERQTELLIRELMSENLRQILVARRGAPLAERCADLDIDIREVLGHIPGTYRATADADLVHVHEGRSTYAAWLRSVVRGTPYILTRRVTNPIGDHYFAHKTYRGAARVVSISPQVRDIVDGFDPQIRHHVIPSSASALPHDPANVERLRASLPGRVVVGNVGALDIQKGQDFLIDAARRFADTHPEICFVLVGGGGAEADLRQRAAGLNNLIFTGFVRNVGDYLATFDIFVLPSRREGLGSVLLDAMEYGLPIVASRVGGVPSVVENEANGLLVESGDVDQLADAIGRLIESPTLRASLGERGRIISREYSARTMAERYAEVYATVLGACRDQASGSH